MKINLSDSAYAYYHTREQNPSESRYLTDDSAAVAFGFCWEEPREIGDIRLLLNAPKSDFRGMCGIEYFAPAVNWCISRQFTWGQGNWVAYPSYGRMEDDLTVVFPAMKIRTVKLRMRVRPPHSLKGLPEFTVDVFGVTELRPVKCVVETGLWGHEPANGEPFIYNGAIERSIRRGNALELILAAADGEPGEGVRTFPDRTVVSIPTPKGTVSFLTADLKKHPYICIPDFGVLVCLDKSALPAGYRKIAPRKGVKILDRVKNSPPQNFERILREVGMEPVRQIAQTKDPVRREPGSFLNVPDPQLNMQWDVGATHLLAFCRPQENGRWEIRNGPYPMLAMESLYITRALDRYKYHDVCRGGHEIYLDSYSVRKPEGLFRTIEGCMCMPYGVKPDDSWLGMDPGCVLVALSEHYFITRDKEWLAGRAEKLLGCCDWILREIRLHKAVGAWDDGLIPPVIGGDISEWFSYFYWNAIFYEGLVKATRAIREIGGVFGDRAAAMQNEIAAFRQAIRTAYRKSTALAPVEPLRDGTFAPGMPPVPYMRGFLSDIYPVSPVIGLRNAWADIDLGPIKLIEAGVFDTDDEETGWMNDVMEDRLMPDPFLLPKKWDRIGTDPITASRDATACGTDYDAEKDWFSWSGTGWQNGYLPLPEVYVMLGERNAYIRTMYNTYAIEADKDTGWFREHAASLTYPPKSFEEAQFLNRLLAGLIYENGDRLYLCGGAPDTWYEKGFGVEGMPTYFGETDLRVDRDGDIVRAHIKIKRATETSLVRITLRHPNGSPIRGLKVNGSESDRFDKGTSFAFLDSALDEWFVEARF